MGSSSRTRTYAAGGLLACLLGAGLLRLWDQRPLPEAPPPPLAANRPAFAKTLRATRFVRGNLHTHTTRSDGDAAPADVARWYRDHGYGFVALTDHNVLSDAAALAPLVGPDFAILPGEEVSMWVHGLQVHVNALCTRTVIPGGDFPAAPLALEHAIGAIRAEDGVALVNHPNFDWALTADDVLAAEGAQLVEIASGHPYVHTLGDATHPSHEQLWDRALTAGHDVMGVAVDDTHHLLTDADPEAFPGVAWVSVFADAPREDLVCDALRRGALYASTGAELRRLVVKGDMYEVLPVDADAVVVFVGAGGRELARVPRAGDGARYRATGTEGYVRARIETSHGLAWTPAVRVTAKTTGDGKSGRTSG